MNNEPNKPIPAQELTEKELEGINGGRGMASLEEAAAYKGALLLGERCE